ncbi:MAG: ribonuclease III, partial [Bacteroidales bacterium]|nr:ribonuclease III [Bacteroidales bacterium]
NAKGVHLYGDAFEAFLGALYLDRGFKVAGKFIYKTILPNYLDVVELEHHNHNYKSQMIEWGQKNRRTIFFDTSIDAPGSRYFLSLVQVDGTEMGSGVGVSKKEAEQLASKMCLEKLGALQEEC